MHKKSIYIKEPTYLLHAIDFGGKGELLFAFHGFGLNALLFEELASDLENKYRIVSVDLFFHGKSFWNENDASSPISIEQWRIIFNRLLEQLEATTFSLLGFSMGNRFVVSLLHLFGSRIQSLYLCAPDGIIPRFAFKAATGSVLNRFVFKWMVFRTANILTLINLLTKLSLISNKLSIFVSQQMYTKRQRRRVYMSWVMFRKLNCSVEELNQIVRKHSIDANLILATRDRILTIPYFKKLIQSDDIKTHYVEASHAGLIAQLCQNKELLKKLFLK